AWLSGQQSKLDHWARFDNTRNPEDEPYFILGHNVCGLPREQARQKGKTADLAFGYMGGKGAWRKLAPDDPSNAAEIKRYQEAWRKAHPATTRFWDAINQAAIKAVQNPSKVIRCNERIAFKRDGDFLQMCLPSGRELAYPFPRLITTPRGECAVIYKDNQHGKWVDCHFGQGAYGGLWTENAVSAVARDVFAAAMQRLEAAGYAIILHVHDEIVAEVPWGFGSPEEFLQILTTLPDWANGLPVAANVREGERFCKIKLQPKAESSVEPEAGQDNASEGSQDCRDNAGRERDHPGEDPSPNSNSRSGYQGNSRDDDNYSSGERAWGRTTAEYIYRTESGEPYLRIDRTTAKQFPQYHRENGRWVVGKPKSPEIPYRLPELLAAAPEAAVWFCEGEKDATHLAALGLVATTYSEGAKAPWPAEITKWFGGKKTVYILEDNDEDG